MEKHGTKCPRCGKTLQIDGSSRICGVKLNCINPECEVGYIYLNAFGIARKRELYGPKMDAPLPHQRDSDGTYCKIEKQICSIAKTCKRLNLQDEVVCE